jgi:hypothetical protein
MKGGEKMTDMEKRQEQEIQRLHQKVKMLLKENEHLARELEQIKETHPEARGKGRPAVADAKKRKVLKAYQQGFTMREIAGQEELAAGTVHKIIKEATKQSRIVYVFADREMPATIIDVCPLTRKVKIVNLTDTLTSRAFGIRENPDWEDYEEFLEDRCMPSTRYGIREELKNLGLDAYDPFLIVQETFGRVYGDHQYLRKMEKDWIEGYDQVQKEGKQHADMKERLLGYLQKSERAWKLNEDQY